jgi:uncharacterized protein (TIRG00374 family)
MLLGVVLYGGFAIWGGVHKIGQALLAFRWWAFGAACGLAFCNYLLRFLKWEFYLARLDIRGVGKVDSLLTFLSGFVLTVTPGKVGEVFKSLVLFETHKVPAARTAPIVVAERVTDLIGVIALIVIGSLSFAGGLPWAAAGATVVVALLVVIASKRLSHAIIGVLQRMPGPFRRIGPKLHDAYDSLAVLVSPANLVLPSLLSVAAWSLECLALYTVLQGFGAPASISLCFFIYATSTLAGALIPVPGGLGVTEGSLEGQLVKLGHVPEGPATGTMILTRFATLWFAVAVGFVALSLLKRRHPGLLAGQASPPSAPRTALPTEPTT